jgi:hypothetical protein
MISFITRTVNESAKCRFTKNIVAKFVYQILVRPLSDESPDKEVRGLVRFQLRRERDSYVTGNWKELDIHVEVSGMK